LTVFFEAFAVASCFCVLREASCFRFADREPAFELCELFAEAREVFAEPLFDALFLAELFLAFALDPDE
jgi:hypothetical protein